MHAASQRAIADWGFRIADLGFHARDQTPLGRRRAAWEPPMDADRGGLTPP